MSILILFKRGSLTISIFKVYIFTNAYTSLLMRTTCALVEHTVLVGVPVSQRSDDQSVSVPQIFIAELKLGVTDVDVTVSCFVIPAVA